jgi:hypothetical protein
MQSRILIARFSLQNRDYVCVQHSGLDPTTPVADSQLQAVTLRWRNGRRIRYKTSYLPDLYPLDMRVLLILWDSFLLLKCFGTAGEWLGASSKPLYTTVARTARAIRPRFAEHYQSPQLAPRRCAARWNSP